MKNKTITLLLFLGLSIYTYGQNAFQEIFGYNKNINGQTMQFDKKDNKNILKIINKNGDTETYTTKSIDDLTVDKVSIYNKNSDFTKVLPGTKDQQQKFNNYLLDIYRNKTNKNNAKKTVHPHNSLKASIDSTTCIDEPFPTEAYPVHEDSYETIAVKYEDRTGDGIPEKIELWERDRYDKPFFVSTMRQGLGGGKFGGKKIQGTYNTRTFWGSKEPPKSW